MTLREFAQSIVEDAEYRQTIVTRARAGTLPPDVELFLLESADGRLPVADDRAIPQSRTFALIRPLDVNGQHEEEDRG